MIRSFVQDRWFPLISLLFTFSAGVLWYISAGALTWEPMMIALFPWVVRGLSGRFPFKRTAMDGFLLLFLLTGAASIALAYDPGTAIGKFWLLVGGVLLFQEIAGQSRRDVWLLASLLSGFSIVVVAYFFMTNNWNAMPSDFAPFTWLGVRWMEVRPNLDTYPLFANQAAGILAILFPFQLALYRYGKRVGDKLYQQWALGTLAVSLFGLLFASSRGAILALAIPLLLWQLWLWCERRVGNRRLSGPFLFASLGGAFVVVTAVVFVAIPSFDTVLLRLFFGNETVDSRSLLVRETWHLIGDYPFLGAGLGSFAGLYAQYIAVTPFYQFGYGHQFWLDMILEQGALGLAAWLAVYAVAVWLLAKTADQKLYVKIKDEIQSGDDGRKARKVKNQSLELGLFRWAILISMAVLLVHSSFDDPLYANRGTPFLFMLPGLAVAVATKRGARPLLPLSRFLRLRVLAPLALVVVVLGTSALFYQDTVRANWAAMWGSVSMSRVELVGFPTGRWDRGNNVDELMPAAAQFEQALAFSPTNRTAHHRLGLIAMLQRDYVTAAAHLEQARAVDPDHRGIQKSLAYSYVWLGEYEQALALLTPVTEAHWEMRNYVSWWQSNGRDDLAERASLMRTLLLENAATDDTATNTQ